MLIAFGYACAGPTLGGGGERASGLERNLQRLRERVDWPTAAFFRELAVTYPSAKFVLGHRSPESWAESFSETIYKLVAERERAPKEMKPWLEMAVAVIHKTGITERLDAAGLTKAFVAHIDAVKSAIPAQRLLIYQVKDGWGPLCAFLDVPVPTDPFPRTNDRGQFWDRWGRGGNIDAPQPQSHDPQEGRLSPS